MGFFTELFARPRPSETMRHRAELAVFDGANRADRVGFVVKPVDFPRIARGMAMR